MDDELREQIDDVSGAYLENRQVSHEFHSPAVQALIRSGGKVSQSPVPGESEKTGSTPGDQETKRQEFIDQQKTSGKTDEDIEAMMGGLEEPWIDPTAAAAAGFGGGGMAAWNAGIKLMPSLARAVASAGVASLADYPLGIATQGVGEKYPKLAMPFNVLVGMVSGMSVENFFEKSIIKAFSKKGVQPSGHLVRDSVERVKANLQSEKYDDELTAAVVRDVNAEYGKHLQKVGDNDIIPSVTKKPGKADIPTVEPGKAVGGIVSELNKTAKEYNLKDLKLKSNITETPKPLNSVIDNEKLFNDYPTLKDIDISYKVKEGVEGVFSEDLKHIYISPELSIEDQIKAIKHEIAHAIQGEKGTLPTSLYKGIDKDFIDYLSDPSEVLARSIELNEEIPEIFNEVFRLREQSISGKGEIEPLKIKGIKKAKKTKVLPGGKDVYIEGWQTRRLLNELKPSDPKPVSVEVETLRLDFGKGNGIIAAEILNKSGLDGVSSIAPFTADVPITDKNISKLKDLFQNHTDKKLSLPKPSRPPLEGGQIPPKAIPPAHRVAEGSPEYQAELEARLTDVLGDSSKPLVELAAETEKRAPLFLQANIQDLPEKAININFANIKSSDDVTEAIAKTADIFSPGIEAARRGKISNEETEKLADLLGMDVKTLLKRRKGEAFNAEQATAARSILVSSAEHLVELSKKASRIDVDDINRLEFIKHLNVHYAIQAQVSGMTAEAGRALQAFGIKVAGVKGQTKAIKELLENLPGRMSTEKIAEMVSQLDTVEGVNTFARQARRATTFDMFLEAWINGLLSGPQTHATNILSNTLFAVWQVPERFLAAGIGSLTGSRAIKAEEALSQAFGLMEGLKDGFKLAAKALRTGEPADQLTKIETRAHRAITAENFRETLPGRLLKKISPNALEQGGVIARGVDLMGEVVRVPGRFLVAEDELFKATGYKTELHARAKRQAIDEGLKDEKMAKRIQEIIQNPEEVAPDIHMAAVDAGRYQTFTQPLGEIGKKYQGILSQVPVLRLITPFVRTPINIMKAGFERTPLAVASKRFWSEIGVGGARRDLALARVSLGSTVMMSTGYLAAQGLITGGGPSDPAMQAAMRRTGWQPYSLKIGDTYISFNRLEPLGILLGAAADFTEISGLAGEEMQPELDKLAAAISLALSKNVTSKTWMRGVAEAMEAVNHADRYGQKYIQNLSRSMVPAISGQIERTVDPEMEAVYSIIDALKSRIPGLSSVLPPRRDLWGEPITTAYSKDRGWIEMAYSALSPFYISKAKDSPIDRELIRLRLPIAKPEKVMSFEGVALNLTPHEYDRFLVLMNTLPLNSTGNTLKGSLDAMVENDLQYRSANPDMKEVMIKRLRNEAKALSNGRLLEESPQLRRVVDYGHRKKQMEGAKQ